MASARSSPLWITVIKWERTVTLKCTTSNQPARLSRTECRYRYSSCSSYPRYLSHVQVWDWHLGMSISSLERMQSRCFCFTNAHLFRRNEVICGHAGALPGDFLSYPFFFFLATFIKFDNYFHIFKLSLLSSSLPMEN